MSAMLGFVIESKMVSWSMFTMHFRFLITYVEFYNWNMFHLEDITENVTNYGYRAADKIASYIQRVWSI